VASSSFRTEIRLKPSEWQIRHTDHFWGIGSCFAEHIQSKLSIGGFNSFSNPCGIVYNPISLLDQIKRSIHDQPWTEEDLVQHGGLFHGIYHHGAYSSPDRSVALDHMNNSLHQGHQHLMKTDVLMITMGSAIGYFHKPIGKLVANCHKIPANEFERKFLTPEEIIENFLETIQALKQNRPDINIILTISPVRYLKEGFTDNSYSKSILVLALQQILKKSQNTYYFPAYEILLDDLRDYRFYKEDMVHPNEQAIDYIWSKFMATYFDEPAIKIWDAVHEFNKARSHRPLHPDTPSHGQFQAELEKRIREMKREFPHLRI
jgi:hypothetical protein